jgi:hypothetical protein
LRPQAALGCQNLLMGEFDARGGGSESKRVRFGNADGLIDG